MKARHQLRAASTFRLTSEGLTIAVMRSGFDGRNRELQPIPQPRPLVVRRGRHVQAISIPENSTAWPWKQELEDAFSVCASVHRQDIDAMIDQYGALTVEMTFLFSSKDKKRTGRIHTLRPDTDNLAKLVMDAMTSIKEKTAKGETKRWRKRLLIDDDDVVGHINVAKVWAEHPGVLIKIKPCDASDAGKYTQDLLADLSVDSVSVLHSSLSFPLYH